MTPSLRKFALTVHVTVSVGWLGAVVVFLALAIVGLASADPQLARGAYLAMQVAGSYVIVPLCLASLATGIVQSLVTKWGLFRHYWVLIKLALTVFATGILLLHTRVIRQMAEVAASGDLSDAAHRGMRLQLVFDASAAVAVLIVATTLAVYKPRGMTRFGRRKQSGA